MYAVGENGPASEQSKTPIHISGLASDTSRPPLRFQLDSQTGESAWVTDILRQGTDCRHQSPRTRQGEAWCDTELESVIVKTMPLLD